MAGKCPKNCDSFRDALEWYVKIMSSILLALSLMVMGIGGYLLANLKGPLSELELSAPAVATVVFGFFLFVFAFCGLYGAIRDGKIALVIFVIGTLFVTLGIFASGIALLAYTSFLERVGASNLEYHIEEVILSYELAVFETCCAGEAVLSCDERNNVFPCFTDQETYANFMQFLSSGTTCQFFSSFEYNGAPLVSKENQASCGNQNQAQFVTLISTFIEDNMQTLGSVNIVLAVLMIILDLSACYLIFTQDDDKIAKKRQIDNEVDSEIM